VIDSRTGETLIEIDQKYFRPTEVDILLGDASKARAVLGWYPRVTFDELVGEMVSSDLKKVALERDRIQRHV
jgi:GDPmannose 4,6-dehydratase